MLSEFCRFGSCTSLAIMHLPFDYHYEIHCFQRTGAALCLPKEEAYTVTNQGILLGFDSCQIELSNRLRKTLDTDTNVLRPFADAIREVFTHLYIPPIPKVKPRIGIISIPIYSRLRKAIPTGKSYISGKNTVHDNSVFGPLG